MLGSRMDHVLNTTAAFNGLLSEIRALGADRQPKHWQITDIAEMGTNLRSARVYGRYGRLSPTLNARLMVSLHAAVNGAVKRGAVFTTLDESLPIPARRPSRLTATDYEALFAAVPA